MNYKVILSSAFVLLAFTCLAQNKEFENFFDIHDSLMRKAYDERNINNYVAAFTRFDEEYNKLSDKDKVYYNGNKVAALYNLSCTYSLLNDKKNAIAYLKKSIDAG